MSKLFQRKIENFTCENCGAVVQGDGYTNHCPACLWSKHVDIQPGDRAESCSGLMRPSRIETTSGYYTIMHQCCLCGAERRVKSNSKDNFEVLLAVAKKAASMR